MAWAVPAAGAPQQPPPLDVVAAAQFAQAALHAPDPAAPHAAALVAGGEAQPSSVTSWAPPGTPPLSDAAAAAEVSPAPEIRPANVAANAYVPDAAELAAFRAAAGPEVPQLAHVTGGFTGTTDEIIQWTAAKWGIPTDVVRAVAELESSWRQAMLGDTAPQGLRSRQPAFARIGDGSTAFESAGITQVKWRADPPLHAGTEPLRWRSTAFALDYWAATVRFYYDGDARIWYGPPYAPGQPWLAVGGWFQPTPWGNPGQLDYAARVQELVAAMDWTRPGF